MEIIKIRKSEEIVKIKITIKYVGPSKYSYAISAIKSFDYKSTDTPPKVFPHEYTIGIGKDLVLIENHNNSVIIQLMNPTAKSLNYELVVIEWFQGDDKTPLYTWPIEGSQQGIVISGKAVILSTDIVFN